MPNYNGLTRNQWPGTFSPSSNHPIVLDTEIRGGLRYVSGDSGDKVTDITGQRLQDGMIVYVENQHTAGTKTFEAGKYYQYAVQSGEARDSSTGVLPNDSDNWSLLNLVAGATSIDSDVRSKVSATDAGGDGSFSYNASTGVFTYTGPSATEARAHLVASTGVTYDSAAGTIAIGQAVGTSDDVTFNSVRGPASFVIDPATVGDNTGTVKILGNLQVEGTTTTINSTTVSLNDKNLVLADSASNAAAADGAGITINGASASLTYAATGDKFVFNKPFEGQYLGFDSDFDSALGRSNSTQTIRGYLSGSTGITYNSTSGAISITNTGVDSATYGSASQIPVLKINAQGQIDSAGSVAVAGVTGLTYDSSSGLLTITTADGSSFTDSINLSPFTTTNLTEGTNKYYTVARSDSDFDKNLDSASTDKLSEGTTNLYYTTARADSAAKAALLGGTGITHDSSSGVISITNTGVTAATYGSASQVPQIAVNAQGQITSASNVSIAGVTGITFDSSSGLLTISTSAGTELTDSINLNPFSTTDLSEGNNLYYTTARADSAFDARFDSSFDERLAISDAGLDSSAILDLIAFDVIGYETNTLTINTLSGLTLIDGGLVTLATNDAFGVLQRDVYDNMEPKGRIESFDAGAIS